MSWKLMKAYLEFEGLAEVASPRATIREAFKQGIISEGDVWLKMLVDRNKTVHTYDEETAIEIFENINETYLKSFLDLMTIMGSRFQIEE